jgi:preprotein translocase subunit SecF
MINIIGKRTVFLSVSGTLMIASIAAIAIFGLKPGIDFTGGALWQFKLPANSTVDAREVEGFFRNDLGVKEIIVQTGAEGMFLIHLPVTPEDAHQHYKTSLEQRFGSVDENRFESVGPTVGAQLKSRAVLATLLVLVAISLYITLSFRKVSYPVKSWKYGVVTLVSLFHDVIIPMGMLAVLGYAKGVEIDTAFVVALLVVVGFSVHDTIVVFDRIRENLLIRRHTAVFEETVNDSINQTLVRSINTSLTLVLVLVAMLIAGAPSLRLFVLVILVGTVVGTYSSIFVASPLLTLWHRFGKNKGR